MAKSVIKLNLKAQLLRKQVDVGHEISQRDIAEALGLSEHTVGKWMRGDVKQYDRELLAAFVDYFGCKIEDILKVEVVEN